MVLLAPGRQQGAPLPLPFWALRETHQVMKLHVLHPHSHLLKCTPFPTPVTSQIQLYTLPPQHPNTPPPSVTLANFIPLTDLNPLVSGLARRHLWHSGLNHI